MTTPAADAPRPAVRPSRAAVPYGERRAHFYRLFDVVKVVNRHTVALCLGISGAQAAVMLSAATAEGRLTPVEYRLRRSDGLRIGYALKARA